MSKLSSTIYTFAALLGTAVIVAGYVAALSAAAAFV